MTNLIEKMAPTLTFDWYVKWIASVLLIIGTILTSNNIFPLNLYFHSLGLFGWFMVAIIWNDRALLVINAVSLAIFVNGMVADYVK